MAKINVTLILLFTTFACMINSENLIDIIKTDRKCSYKRYLHNNLSNFKNISGQVLNIKVPINTVLKRNQPKRFIIKLEESSPLTIKLSAQNLSNIERTMYFNQSINLSRTIRNDTREIFYPCAMRGHYDLFLNLRTKKHNRIKIEIEMSNQHPYAQWPLLNRSSEVRLRTQNRIQKKQMILKWSKSQLDIHAVHYCIIINTVRPKLNFCKAVGESMERKFESCQGPVADVNWFKQRTRIKEIDSNITNLVCTGKKSLQILRGFLPNVKYFISIFGIHIHYRSLPFLLKSTATWFNRSHPNVLKENDFSLEKISGMTGVSVFSYKAPLNISTSKLRYLILPCGGSEINAKILFKRREILAQNGIYKPTYVNLHNVNPGNRYILRITPSNEDEELRANKVGLALTTQSQFTYFPELPENITVYEIRSVRDCRQTRIAWHQAPGNAFIKYCIIILTLPINNRSSIESTNYCLDFSKNITKHKQFHSLKCINKTKKSMETADLINLNNGSYLVYITLHSSATRPLPYQSLKINFNSNKYCDDDFDDDELIDLSDKNQNILSQNYSD